jgi:DNA-binding transcriptional LysR family regulator
MGIDLDLRRLRFFVEVVRQGGFSQASKVVFAAQPTVSKAVKQLEQELGVPLLDRGTRRSTPTPAGAMVYRRGLALLAASEDLVWELDELRGVKRGTLRVGFPRLGSSALFAPLFASFRKQYPGIEVQFAVHDSKRLEEMLRAGELDLAALLHPISEDFEWDDVRSDPLAVLLPRTHPLANKRSIGLPKLAHFPLILFEEGLALNDLILEAFRKKGLSPKVAARSSQVDFIFELVAAGTGIGFLPRVIADQRGHRSVRCVALDEPRCEWRIAFAWRRAAHLSAAAQAWLAHGHGKRAAPRA